MMSPTSPTRPSLVAGKRDWRELLAVVQTNCKLFFDNKKDIWHPSWTLDPGLISEQQEKYSSPGEIPVGMLSWPPTRRTIQLFVAFALGCKSESLQLVLPSWLVMLCVRQAP